MTKEEFAYHTDRLLHAIQSGVAMQQEQGSLDGSPKHLRVGVNNALCEIGAVAKLLIKKGVFTDEEYFDAVVAMLEEEVGRYEKALSLLLNAPVKLA